MAIRYIFYLYIIMMNRLIGDVSLQKDTENDGAKGHELISQTEELFMLMSAELNDMIAIMRD